MNKRAVTLSIADVSYDEITVRTKSEDRGQIVNREPCKQAVMNVFQANGYVCQLRLILTASAKYDADLQTKMTLNGKLKNAIEEKIQSSLTRSQDGTWSGDSLEYGIQMDRLCLTPENAFFSRLCKNSL